MAWMEPVSGEPEQQGAGSLGRCLLSAHADVFRVPWEDLIYPRFMSLPHNPEDSKDSPGEDGDASVDASVVPFRQSDSSPLDVKPLPCSEKHDQSPRCSAQEHGEGEYVELTGLPLPSFSPQRGSLTQSISLQVKVRSSARASQETADRQPTPDPTKPRLSGARPLPQAGPQPSASPPAEDQGAGRCGGKTWMFTKERGGNVSAWKEEQKEQMTEPVEGRDGTGGQKESDGEQLAEVVEVEEEVHISWQNGNGIQENETTADVQTEAGSRDSLSNTCSSGSSCQNSQEPRQSAASYSDKEESVLAPPSTGPGGGSKGKEEAPDEAGAPGDSSHGTFSSLPLSFSSCS